MPNAVRSMRSLALVGCTAVAALASSACASKGYVNRKIDHFVGDERASRLAGDSTNARDVAAVRTDLNALRGELQTLRTEFGARITAMENSVKFAMPVHFAYDDATVRAEDQAGLERFAQVIQKHYNGAQVTVEGFADPSGAPRYNLALSRRRADSVREFLVGKGMTGDQLKAVGYGESRQVRPGAARDTEGAELNRRVVFVVETPGAGVTTTAALR